MTDASKSHSDRRADGQRQVGVGAAPWPSASAASSSTPTACRSIASCAFFPARPTPEEEARVPHALYGFVPASEAYSAGRLRARCRAQRSRRRAATGRRAHHRRRHRSLFQGAARGPLADPARSTTPCAIIGGPKPRGAVQRHCIAMLAQRDPTMAARLMPADTQRSCGRWRCLNSTGRSLAEWQRAAGPAGAGRSRDRRTPVLPDRSELRPAPMRASSA